VFGIFVCHQKLFAEEKTVTKKGWGMEPHDGSKRVYGTIIHGGKAVRITMVDYTLKDNNPGYDIEFNKKKIGRILIKEPRPEDPNNREQKKKVAEWKRNRTLLPLETEFGILTIEKQILYSFWHHAIPSIMFDLYLDGEFVGNMLWPYTADQY